MKMLLKNLMGALVLVTVMSLNVIVPSYALTTTGPSTVTYHSQMVPARWGNQWGDPSLLWRYKRNHTSVWGERSWRHGGNRSWRHEPGLTIKIF